MIPCNQPPPRLPASRLVRVCGLACTNSARPLSSFRTASGACEPKMMPPAGNPLRAEKASCGKQGTPEREIRCTPLRLSPRRHAVPSLGGERTFRARTTVCNVSENPPSRRQMDRTCATGVISLSRLQKIRNATTQLFGRAHFQIVHSYELAKMFKINWTRHLPRRLQSHLHFLEVPLETGLKTYVLSLHQVFSPYQPRTRHAQISR
jgi:hypothetical protein